MVSKKRKTVLNNPLVIQAKADHLDSQPLTQVTPELKKKGNSPQSKPKQLKNSESELVTVIKKSESDSTVREIFSAEITALPIEASKPIKTNQLPDSLNTASAIFAKELQLGIDFSKPIDLHDRKKRVDAIIYKWAWISVPAGLINLPLIDSAALLAIQVKMISEICKCYGVAFEKESTKAIIAGLMSGTITTTVVFEMKRLVLNNLPFVGNTLSAVTAPTLNFASTYSIGYLFTQHFENSDSLHDFKYENIKDSFSVLFEKGKAIFKTKIRV
jgi:uncharacterized protein (DUF697 family)